MPRIDAEKPGENPQEVDDEEKDEDFARSTVRINPIYTITDYLCSFDEGVRNSDYFDLALSLKTM